MLRDLPNPACCLTDDVGNLCPKCLALYNARHQARGLTANARVTSNGKKSPENMSDGELLDSHNAHVAEMKKRGIQPVKPPVDDDEETDNDDDAYTQPTTNAAEAPFVSRRLLEHLGKGRKASVANAVSGKAAKAETTGVSPALLKRLGKG